MPRLRYFALNCALSVMVDGKVEVRHDRKRLGTAAVRNKLSVFFNERIFMKGCEGLANRRKVLVVVECGER